MPRTKKETKPEMRVYRLRNKINENGKLQYYFVSAKCKPYEEAGDLCYVTTLEAAEGIGCKGQVVYVDNNLYGFDPEQLKKGVLRRLSADASNYMQSLAMNREQFNQLRALQPEARKEPNAATA